MWIIGNSFGRRKISTGYEVTLPRCLFLASEQISRNRFSATEPWAAGTDYLGQLSMQILCRHSNQDTTDSSKIWEIKAHQLLIPSTTSTSTSRVCKSDPLSHIRIFGYFKSQIRISGYFIRILINTAFTCCMHPQACVCWLTSSCALCLTFVIF